jgi:hypothetical protein
MKSAQEIGLRIVLIAGSAATILCGVAVAKGLTNDTEQSECHVTVLRTVTDDLGNIWSTGKIIPVDIERDNSSGGSFCAHGGSCIPRRVGGLETVKLSDCQIGTEIMGNDHALNPGRRKMNGTPPIP